MFIILTITRKTVAKKTLSLCAIVVMLKYKMEMKNGENILKILLRDKEYEITKNKDGKYSIPKEIKELLQISVSCINIDGNRVETSDDLARINKDDNGMFGVGNNNNNKAQQMKEQGLEYGGRYPAQTLCDSNTAELLD